MDRTADNSCLAAVSLLESSTRELSDDELVTAVCAGDEVSFEHLFERHQRLVIRLASRFFHRREEIEEIIQESFAGAYFALSTYQSREGKSFAAWLSRITINTCYDQLRRTRRRKESAVSELSEAEAAYLEARLQSEGGGSEIESLTVSRDLARKLLARLEPEDRLVLTLLKAEEMSVAEIAEITGWSVSKVKMRVLRARCILQRVLRRLV
jgi:RNA polymerase sigma-70 factor (ECF subfamily)